MARAERPPYGIICLWQMKEKSKRTDTAYIDSNWEIVEAYPVDDDGRPTGPTINVTGRDRYPHDKWMRKPIEDEEGEAYDSEDIMGRAVTMWSMSGVSVLDLHPGTWKSVQWSNFHGILELIKRDNETFRKIFKCAGHMIDGTIEKANELIRGIKPEPPMTWKRSG